MYAPIFFLLIDNVTRDFLLWGGNCLCIFHSLWFNLLYIFVHLLQYLTVLYQYWYDRSEPCYIYCPCPDLLPQDKKSNVQNWLQFWGFVQNICPKLYEILKIVRKLMFENIMSENIMSEIKQSELFGNLCMLGLLAMNTSNLWFI